LGSVDLAGGAQLPHVYNHGKAEVARHRAQEGIAQDRREEPTF